MASLRFTLMLYPGSAQVLAELLPGEADAMPDPAHSSMPHVRAGRLTPLGTTCAQRAESLPDLPTVGEVLPGHEGGFWFGLGSRRHPLPAECPWGNLSEAG
jgi:tripartite-type tricarboxylate transporter receptor subunit TctC